MHAERTAEFLQLQCRIEHLTRTIVGLVTLEHAVDGAELVLVLVERFTSEAHLQVVFARGIFRHQIRQLL